MAYSQASMLFSLVLGLQCSSAKRLKYVLAYIVWLVNLFIFVVANYMFQFSLAKLYLPKVNKSSGAVINMWIKVKFQSSFLHESIEKEKYPIPPC